MNTPSLSYHMPAEWEHHRACLILYPHNTGVFRSSTITKCDESSNGIHSEIMIKCGPARMEVRNVARTICNYGQEDVFIFCNTIEEAEELRAKLKEEENANENESNQNQIFVKVCKSDDSWCRDTGPTFVKTTALATDSIIGLDWKFNAYGGPESGCYWPCTNDQKVAQTMIKVLSNHYNNSNNGNNCNEDNKRTSTDSEILHQQVDIILEGGSFHTDGEGTILTTEECLLNPNRNPNMSKEDISKTLCQYLGGSKVIWLPFGIFNDEDTNGHVDNIATFAKPGHVVLSWTDDVNDANYERFKAAEEILLNELDARGRKIVVHKLHVPRPLYYTTEEVNTLGDGNTEDNASVDACEREIGDRLAASYVNYYLANNAIILPQFGDTLFDKRAEETMQSIFPLKKILGVHSREILLGGGNIHCITQQLP